MISPELRARVDTAVRELAYIPNQLASSLASAAFAVMRTLPNFV